MKSFKPIKRSVHTAIAMALFLAFITCSFDRLAGDDQDTQWKTARVVQAPEAVQAAAADEKFLYAISSRQVAKYERSTGRRLAISTGEAEHLNSGLLFEGKLLCAHSNYPHLPEQSTIIACDLDTMRLTTFHNFNNNGGSLTWVLRKGDAWWCNFAFYGEDNAQTYLAKFDDHWNEIQRWTYPLEVIEQLGNYSLSGGIWLGEELLVSGHDDQVLFRVAIPHQGETLNYLGKQSAPFSGQGFAIDPVSGGLIGIHRARRELILTSPIEDATR